MELNSVSAAYFEKFVGHSFSVAGIDGCELILDRIDALPRQDQSTRDPFALLFSGQHAEPLAQQIYQLHHAEDDPIEIFLVPVGQSESGFLYEAVFN